MSTARSSGLKPSGQGPSRHVWRAFRGTLAALVVTFSVLLTLASQAGIFGLPLAAILLSWFGKYVFVVIDTVAHGHEEPPVLSLDMVAPFTNWRGLALVAIVGVPWLLFGWLEPVIGTGLTLVLRALLVAAVPACVAILAIESNPLKALNPEAQWRVATGLRHWYAVLLAACAIAIAAQWFVAWLGPWLIVRIAFDLALVMALASLLGGALYERRDALGIEAWHSPERSAARAARETQREQQHFLDEVFAFARNRSHANAWRAIEQRLERAQHADSEYDWLLVALQRLEDPRHLAELRQRYIERLVSARRSSDAVKVLERIWQLDPSFQLRDAAATVTLARVALDAGTQRAARLLLRDFAQRFAGHPAAPIAQALVARITSDR